MNNKGLQWNRFIKGQIIFSILPWTIVLIYIVFMRDPSEPFMWGFVIWAVLFTAFLVILYIVRRLYLGLLIIQDLDFQTVYELDKRSEKNKKHNLQLLLNCHFYNGRVEETKDICEKLLALTLTPNEAYGVHHTNILTEFLWGDTTNLEAAIAQQEQLATQKGVKPDATLTYYRFIRLYLQEQYAQAVEAVAELLNDDIIKIYNSRKVMVYTLMHMAYEKMGDTEQMQACKMNILQSDLHLRTIFARQVCGD